MWLAALVVVFATLFGVSVLIGVLITDVLARPSVLGGDDVRAIRSLVGERTAGLTDLSSVGSAVGGGVVLPIVAGIVGLGCAVARRWRIAAFVVFALLMESATYRLTSEVVPRQRPPVERLEQLPVDASYPSGHTAASIAVYAGLALLISSRYHQAWVRAIVWTLAVLLPVFVAVSRMYRGMHHPLDVAGGMTVGVGALIAMLFVSRAAWAAARARVTAREAQPTRVGTVTA